MKTTLTLRLATIGVVAVLFNTTACKKSDDNGGSNSNLSATAQKIVGTWGLESNKLAYTNANGSAGTVYNNLKDCEKDDIYTFNADKTYSVTDGSQSCNAAGGYGSGYIWRVPDDSSLDFAHGPAWQGISKIEQLDNTTLKLGAPIPPNGRATFIFKRK